MSNSCNKIYSLGECRLEVERPLLWRNEQPVTIPPKVYELLLVLVGNRGQSLSKDDLSVRVWPDMAFEESNSTVSLSALRKVLGERRGQHQFTATLPSVGNQFVALAPPNAPPAAINLVWLNRPPQRFACAVAGGLAIRLHLLRAQVRKMGIALRNRDAAIGLRERKPRPVAPKLIRNATRYAATHALTRS